MPATSITAKYGSGSGNVAIAQTPIDESSPELVSEGTPYKPLTDKDAPVAESHSLEQNLISLSSEADSLPAPTPEASGGTSNALSPSDSDSGYDESNRPRSPVLAVLPATGSTVPHAPNPNDAVQQPSNESSAVRSSSDQSLAESDHEMQPEEWSADRRFSNMQLDIEAERVMERIRANAAVVSPLANSSAQSAGMDSRDGCCESSKVLPWC